MPCPLTSLPISTIWAQAWCEWASRWQYAIMEIFPTLPIPSSPLMGEPRGPARRVATPRCAGPLRVLSLRLPCVAPRCVVAQSGQSAALLGRCNALRWGIPHRLKCRPSEPGVREYRAVGCGGPVWLWLRGQSQGDRGLRPATALLPLAALPGANRGTPPGLHTWVLRRQLPRAKPQRGLHAGMST